MPSPRSPSPQPHTSITLASENTRSTILKEDHSLLLSLPPEVLLSIADEVASSSYSSTRCTLTYCNVCNLPFIGDLNKLSLISFGLAHPYLFKLLEGHRKLERCTKTASDKEGCVEGGFGWLYRCWRWLSERPRRSSLSHPSGCDLCHPGYMWQGNWPKLTAEVEKIEAWERVLQPRRRHICVLTTDRWYVWRHYGRR